MQTVTVTIDRDMSLQAMIGAGMYEFRDPDITEKNFPTPNADSPHRSVSDEIILEIFHLNEVMTTDKIESELDRRGLRSATLMELLALGAQHPELQRRFPLLALVSSLPDSEGRRLVPCLATGGNGGLSLLLYPACSSTAWSDHCRFVAVRK